MNRLALQPNISGSFSFHDRATAEDSVAQIIDANQIKVADWLSGTDGRLRLDASIADAYKSSTGLPTLP